MVQASNNTWALALCNLPKSQWRQFLARPTRDVITRLPQELVDKVGSLSTGLPETGVTIDLSELFL
jgi:hypothetical protein